MKLQKIERDFSICKLDNVEQVDFSQDFIFLQKTSDEVSIVCESINIPSNAVSVEAGWKAVRVSGVLDFGLIGVIAGISKILADAKIGIFVISTFNTDYIFMKSEEFPKGVQLLEQNGYTIKQELHKEKEAL